MYNIDLRRDCNRAYNTVNNVLNAVHSVLTALIVYLMFASTAAVVELVQTMLAESIEKLLVVKLVAELMGADASNSSSADDVHRDRPVALIDNMMCLACTGDRRLDRLLAYNSWIDTVASSTYHVDAVHMRSTMADMWDSAFDAVALNNGLVSVKPVALVIVVAVPVEELLVLTLGVVVDIEMNVTVLWIMEQKNSIEIFRRKINKIRIIINTISVYGLWENKCFE